MLEFECARGELWRKCEQERYGGNGGICLKMGARSVRREPYEIEILVPEVRELHGLDKQGRGRSMDDTCYEDQGHSMPSAHTGGGLTTDRSDPPYGFKEFLQGALVALQLRVAASLLRSIAMMCMHHSTPATVDMQL